MGPSALNLCATIRKITTMKSCRARENPEAIDAREDESDNRTTVDPLPASISVIVQRHNAQMIIERQPPPAKLLAAGIEKCHQAAVRVKEWAEKKLRSDLSGNGPVSRMESECPPVATLAGSTTQNQPTHHTAQSTTPTTVPSSGITQALFQPSHLDPDPMKINHPLTPELQHQRQPSNSIADTTPLSEAQNTQKNKQSPTSGASGRHASCPHPNLPGETHTQAGHPNTAPEPAIVTQTQWQPHPSHSAPMDCDANHDDDMVTHSQNTSGHSAAWREPTAAVRPKLQLQHQTSNSIADTTPLPEAHNTQKNKQWPTSGGSRWHVPRPYLNRPDETHTQAGRPNTAPVPATTTQTQLQSHPSHFTPMECDTNHDDDMGTLSQSTSGHTKAWCGPTPPTSETTKPTINPEIKQPGATGRR